MTPDTTTRAVTPRGINHLVLNVRDMDESHRFWTDIVGFKQVGELRPNESRPNQPRMRFYSGEIDGKAGHHDLALCENPNLPAPPDTWEMFGMPSAVNHIAITLPDRESWLRQMEHVRACGVHFNRRIEHGMTHSLYINDPNGYGIELLYELPREVWGEDIDAALNYALLRPTEGEEAFEDEHENVPVFGGRQPAE